MNGRALALNKDSLVTLTNWASDFIRKPGHWNRLLRIGDSNIVKSTILVPLIGYMIIFNENLVNELELAEFFVFKEKNEASYRLFFIYFGLSFIGFASMLFHCFCPGEIRFYKDLVNYAESEMKIASQYRIDELVGRIETFLKRNDAIQTSTYNMRIADVIVKQNYGFVDEKVKLSENEFKFETLKFYWHCQNINLRSIRRIIWILYALGFLIIAIPTCDTFIRIFRSFISLLF